MIIKENGILRQKRKLWTPREGDYKCDLLPVGGMLGLGGGVSRPVNTTDFLQDLTTLGLTGTLELCLDAGDSTSWTGSGKWNDLDAGGHDFFLGAATSTDGDEPTFNGVSGGLSDSEYWTYDGGDIFGYDTTTPTFIENQHKNGADFTIILWEYVDAANGGSFYSSFQGSGFTNTGFSLAAGGTQSVQLVCANSTGTPALLFIADTPPITAAGWRMMSLSLDEAAGAGGSFFAQNDAYHQVSSANTFDGTYASPDAGNSTGQFQIGSDTNPADTGRRTAGLMIFSSSLTKTNIDDIYNETKTRFP